MQTCSNYQPATAVWAKVDQALPLQTWRVLLCAAVATAIIAGGTAAFGQDPALPQALRTVAVPEPSQLATIVADKRLAIVLGKALFWDMQVGSDNIQACASCHFHAGADSRAKNQLSPGLRRVHPDLTPDPDTTFATGANFTLSEDDFPLTILNNPQDRASGVAFESNDVVSSQGIFFSIFADISGTPEDEQTSEPDPDGFQVDGVNVRRVELRHTPTCYQCGF